MPAPREDGGLPSKGHLPYNEPHYGRSLQDLDQDQWSKGKGLQETGKGMGWKNGRERRQGMLKPGEEESPEAVSAMGERRIRQDHQGGWGSLPEGI